MNKSYKSFKSSKNEEDENDGPGNSFCKLVLTKQEHQNFTAYLLDSIAAPQYYIDLIHTLREADPETSHIDIIINSPGGYLTSAIQLVAAIKQSNVPVTTHLMGEAHSAASMIFLAGDNFVISKNSTMLCHYYSAGDYGKGHELKASSDFRDKHIKDFYTDIYAGFFTNEELDHMCNDGRDYWLDTEQIMHRLKHKVEYMKQLEKEEEAAEEQRLLDQLEKKTKKKTSTKKKKTSSH